MSCLTVLLLVFLTSVFDLPFTASVHLRRLQDKDETVRTPLMAVSPTEVLQPHTPHERHAHSRHFEHPHVNVFAKRKKMHGTHSHFGDPHHQDKFHNGSIIVRVKEAIKMHNGSINVVLLGDSMLSHIQLNATQWEPFQLKYKVMNLGAPRDRSEHILFRLSNKDATAPIANVKHVVVMIGTNNVGVGDSVETVFNGISSVVMKTRAVFDRNTTVLLLGLLPRPNNANTTRIMTKINAKLSDRFFAISNVFYLDIFEKFVFKMSRVVNREMFMPDNMHPNSRGYDAIIEAIKPHLEGKVPPKTVQSVISSAMLTRDSLPHLSSAMAIWSSVKKLTDPLKNKTIASIFK